jgi:hypothetical protein
VLRHFLHFGGSQVGSTVTRCDSAAETLTGKVIFVTDGDTLALLSACQLGQEKTRQGR